MKYVLDGMVELMEGTGSFDDDLYESFVQCFEQTDPQLMASQVQNSFTNQNTAKKSVKQGFIHQDAEWTGMIQWAASGGSEDDQWLRCDEADEVKMRLTTMC